ncbi:hypothetical protein [Rhabdochlamydiaceae symbiont of Dictyostelium giganteum]|uniref:hypothetical protein n=1 Tax=Rhabdochlamydiaceae symbiont of Dictyostelium giganteum TaxID=3342349 RepID=UPI00384D80A8
MSLSFKVDWSKEFCIRFAYKKENEKKEFELNKGSLESVVNLIASKTLNPMVSYVTRNVYEKTQSAPLARTVHYDTKVWIYNLATVMAVYQTAKTIFSQYRLFSFVMALIAVGVRSAVSKTMDIDSSEQESLVGASLEENFKNSTITQEQLTQTILSSVMNEQPKTWEKDIFVIKGHPIFKRPVFLPYSEKTAI